MHTEDSADAFTRPLTNQWTQKVQFTIIQQAYIVQQE